MNPLEEFERHLRSTCGSERTVIAYVSDARQFLSFLGERPADIGAVEAWVSFLNHGSRKPQTITRKRAALRRLLGFMARYGDETAAKTLAILRDYKVTPAIRQSDVESVRPIGCEEFSRIQAVAPPMYRALFDFIWWTGARISEVLGDPVAGIPPLTVGDGLLLVRDGLVQTLGKGGKIRVLVLPAGGRDVLRSYVEAEEWRASPSRALFPLTPQAVNSRLHGLGFGGGIHAFRHAFRARLRQAGIGEDIARALLGHGPKDVTAHYGAPTSEELLAAVEHLQG